MRPIDVFLLFSDTYGYASGFVFCIMTSCWVRIRPGPFEGVVCFPPSGIVNACDLTLARDTCRMWSNNIG